MREPLKRLGYFVEDSALLASITGRWSSRVELASTDCCPRCKG
jgi:hypothetical protein